uniref:Thioredoxin domain-containing protein n=1 Tax=Caenorhabditis tropicalis TaxID=1561998 RepID=A0A1I7TQU8_9PELO
MILQLVFSLAILMTTIQTVMDLKAGKNRKLNEFPVNPEDIATDHCEIQEALSRANHFLYDTCPTEFDPICNDPIFNKYNEFEFRCRFPMRTNSVLTMNSTAFLELMKMRDPYARDWCMVVMFHSPTCPFSARLAPHFNKIAGKFENILPIAVDASDFTKTHRLNFRYGVSGTPTVLLWVNGIGVARMGNKKLDVENIKSLITSHTDLQEIKNSEEPKENKIPEKFIELGAELKELFIEGSDNQLMSFLWTLACVFVCIISFIYHVRERILLSAPVLRWFQSKCGGPLCEDIYFLFYVAAPRNRAPPPPPPLIEEALPPNDDEFPQLIIDDDDDEDD